MAILNYTTKVPIKKTVMEIQDILIKHGTDKIIIDYADMIPVSVTFSVMFKNKTIFFTLPTNTKGVLQAMKNSKIEKRYLSEEQAQKTAWRILKDWIESQMAIVEAELAEMPQVFLGYSHCKSGNTLWDEINENQSNLLK